MLPHFEQFGNHSFSACSTPAWRGPATVWQRYRYRRLLMVVARSVRYLASLARIRRPLQAGRTPIPLSTTQPYVTRTYSPMQHAAACMWWTPLALSFFNDEASTRRQQLHVLVLAAAYSHAPEYSAVLIPRSTGRGTFGVPWFGEKHPRGLGRSTPVVWGEAPPWFGEKHPRGLGRR